MAEKRGTPAPGPADPDAALLPHRDPDEPMSVLIEMRSRPGMSAVAAMSMAGAMATDDLALDPEFQPVPMGGAGGTGGGNGVGALSAGPTPAAAEPTYVLRATVADEEHMERLRQRPEVAAVWLDTPIGPVHATKSPPVSLRHPHAVPDPSLSTSTCAIPPCDCAPSVPKGGIDDVAAYLGANQVWAAGIRGTGIVVGVVDGGITAQGRPVKSGETTRRIPRVIGGWPSDWGTEAAKWGEHGNMCATDVLGMAPEAQIYDLRIAGGGGLPGTISRALQAFQWCIDRHRVDGTPHVLSNSWGIFQEAWDPVYARDPNHPFTRKVVEAIQEGILLLFAAGNCGGACPDGRCGGDSGPGRSIWGANGHRLVMTVGAVNRNEEFVGYSSQGPAALHADKPDFCGITHFTGYFQSDSGTSAATPIVAGVVALLKQAKPALTQEEALDTLRQTAKDIGAVGFDRDSGAGIVRAKAAYDRVRGAVPGVNTVRLFRYWNARIGDHFYTTDWNELGYGRHGWVYEGVQGHVYPVRRPNTVPLYRYWNPRIGDHFYTTNWNELGRGRYGYLFEGVQCWVRPAAAAGFGALYRYWNPRIGDHFYTTDWRELGWGRNGWYFEGVQCYIAARPAMRPELEPEIAAPAVADAPPVPVAAVPEPFPGVAPPVAAPFVAGPPVATPFVAAPPVAAPVAAAPAGPGPDLEPQDFEVVGSRLIDSFRTGEPEGPLGPSFELGEGTPNPIRGSTDPSPFVSVRGRGVGVRRQAGGDVTVRVEFGQPDEPEPGPAAEPTPSWALRGVDSLG